MRQTRFWSNIPSVEQKTLITIYGISRELQQFSMQPSIPTFQSVQHDAMIL